MKYRSLLIVFLLLSVISLSGCVNKGDYVDEIKFGNTTVTWLGHSSFEVSDAKSVIYLDPYVLPQHPDKADYILISHDHFDHCDPAKVSEIQTASTRIITTYACIQKGLTGKTNTLRPGEFFAYDDAGLKVEAIDAYNIKKNYHPKDTGIGFVITLGGKKFYFAGDTDNIPEMSNLTGIYMAFLPIGGTYTMDVNEAAAAAKVINPKIVVPMHYNSDKYGIKGINADPEKLKELLKGTDIQVVLMNPRV